MTDVEGKRYLDCLAGYSALNFGHGHPRLVARARGAARPADADQPGVLQRPARPVRAGPRRAHRQGDGPADEHRRRGRRDRDQGQPQVGLPGQGRRRRTRPRIVAMEGNFHGRTTTIVSFSDRHGRDGRLRAVHPGLPARCRTATSTRSPAPIDDTTVAVLLEPMQGEGGVIIPPEGYLQRRARALPRAGRADGRRRDPVGPGAGRARRFACDHEDVVPDIYILGKALGGGLYPVSAIAADRDVLGVITPGTPRLDLRRQPAGRGHRPRGRRDAADRGVPGARRARSAPASTAGLRELVGHGVDRGPGAGAVGRRRRRPGPAQRARALRGPARAGGARQGHPRLRPSASPRRWWPARTTSTSCSTRSAAPSRLRSPEPDRGCTPPRGRHTLRTCANAMCSAASSRSAGPIP